MIARRRGKAKAQAALHFLDRLAAVNQEPGRLPDQFRCRQDRAGMKVEERPGNFESKVSERLAKQRCRGPLVLRFCKRPLAEDNFAFVATVDPGIPRGRP